MSHDGLSERKGVRNFQDLEVWRKAHALVLEIYAITKRFPQDERYGLISQMRRAAVSVPANITEGFRKKGTRDKLNFYNVAQASLDELYYYVILSRDLGYQKDNSDLIERIEETARMLFGLCKSFEERMKN